MVLSTEAKILQTVILSWIIFDMSFHLKANKRGCDSMKRSRIDVIRKELRQYIDSHKGRTCLSYRCIEDMKFAQGKVYAYENVLDMLSGKFVFSERQPPLASDESKRKDK